jgi:hypothetical protein
LTGLDLLLSADISIEALRALQSIARQYEAKEISAEAAAEAAAEIAPSRFSFFKNLTRSEKLQIFAVLAPIIGAIITTKMSGNEPTVVINNYAPKPAITETIRSYPRFPALPEVGPLPPTKPKQNRHERRKAKKLAPRC